MSVSPRWEHDFSKIVFPVLTLQGSTQVSRTQNGTVPEEAKIHLFWSLFANFIERVFSNKTWKNITPTGTVRSGCQNGTVPEEAKIHLSYGLFANVIERVKK